MEDIVMGWFEVYWLSWGFGLFYNYYIKCIRLYIDYLFEIDFVFLGIMESLISLFYVLLLF